MYIQNFQVIRNRSMKLWETMDHDLLHWRPHAGSASCIEIIRLILESEVLHFLYLLQSGNGTPLNPLANLPFATVETELKQSQRYREQFLQLINSYLPKEFEKNRINVEERSSPVSLSNYLLNIMRQESEYYGLLQAYRKLYKGLTLRA